METPISIANYFVNKSLYEGVELTPMKVLKLVYLAHGWNLGLHNKPLLTEAVEAWKFGPVVKSVYEAFKKHKDRQIDNLAIDLSFGVYPLPKDESNKKLLDRIWDVYKNYNGLQLSTLTHEKDSPWDIVWNKQSGKTIKSAIIPNGIIANYYSTKAAPVNG